MKFSVKKISEMDFAVVDDFSAVVMSFYKRRRDLIRNDFQDDFFSSAHCLTTS